MSEKVARHRWLAPADKLVRKYYPACGAPIVAEMLGLEKHQVRQYASKIGVKTRNRGGKMFRPGHDDRRGPGRKMRKSAAAPAESG